MKRPKFTREQLAWLKIILTPPCCHVSGEHNSTHFKEDPKIVCGIQARGIYAKVLKELRFAEIPGVSKPNCVWCHP